MNGSTPPISERTLRRRLARKTRLARLALAWEALWSALWPTPLIVAAFLVFALLDLPALIGGELHLALLVLFGVALVAALVVGLRRFRWPSEADAARRIEQSSGLRHRPLTVLGDRPAEADRQSRALWELHQQRVRAGLKKLRAGVPRSALPRRDAWAVRGAALVALVAGFVVAGDRSFERIAYAFQPALGPGPVAAPTIDLWVEPPDYTGAPPVFARREVPTLTFPAGSRVVARVTGGEVPPVLAVDQGETVFEASGQTSFAASVEVGDGSVLAVRQDEELLAQWSLQVIPDAVPRAFLTRAPVATERLALRIDYKAEDDYGFASLSAELRRVGADGAAAGDPLTLPIPSPGLRVTAAQGSIYNDLTAHAWAGEEVEIQVVAVDGAGQRGESDRARVTLPERSFTHPIARLIIDARKKLADDRQSRSDTARRLDAIARMGEMFDDDTVVHLGLSTAKWRLRRDQADEAVDAVRDLLWEIALRLEDGGLTLAERELRDAQQALMDALQRDASQAEIDQALNRLWSAIQKFLDSMMAQAGEQPPLTPEQMRQMQSVEAQDLREMLQRMRELAQSGAKDAAMQMLAQLQNMLENLQAARAAGQNAEAAQRMMEMMRELQEMTQQQRDLLDQTFRDAQQGQGAQPMPGEPMPGGQPGMPQSGQMGQQGDPQGLSSRQEQLRRMLGDLMRRLGEQSGEIPNAFGRAERAMRDAVGNLERGEAGQAVEPQSEALDQLQQAGRSMIDELARQMGMGEPGPEQAGETNPGFDPLGRPPGGRGLDSRDVVIPGEADIQRARDIRDELYRRSGERTRPQFERDYIDRLLERF